jgi:hypothetical protein
MDVHILLKDYGSIIASITALFLGLGGARWILSKLFKSSIEFVTIKKVDQPPTGSYWRIVLINNGNDIAENVQVDVICMIENKLPRSNFLPVPLRWTHLNCDSRSILTNQTVYLDFLKPSSDGGIELAINYTHYIPDLVYINTGNDTKIKITVYQKNGHNIQLYFTCKEIDGSFGVKRDYP